MASNITVTGLDLDNIFKARTTIKTGDVNIQVTGLDISNRYEKSVGGDLIAFNTNYQTGGVDIKNKFQKISYVALSVAVSPSSASAGCVHPCTATTAGITATPSGGSGSYSYSWTIAGSLSGATINNATNPTCTVSWTSAVASGNGGTIQCTVTDTSNGATVISSTVSISFTIT